MRKRTLWPAWTLAGAFFAMSAGAQTGPKVYPPCTKTPTEGDVAAAKGAFQAGNASFNEADYDRAIVYWEDAYRRDCTAHLLLLNLARAYELNEQRGHAVVALETYIARNPGSPDEPQIRRRIDKLQDQIDEERVREAALAPAPAVSPSPEPPPPPKETVAAPADPAPPSDERSIVPLIVAGAGAAVTITGSVLYLHATSQVSSIEERCPLRDGEHMCDSGTDEQQADLAEQGNDARRRQVAGSIVAAVGVGALAGGLLWYFLQDSTAPEGSATAGATRVEPRLGPGFAGAALSASFF